MDFWKWLGNFFPGPWPGPLAVVPEINLHEEGFCPDNTLGCRASECPREHATTALLLLKREGRLKGSKCPYWVKRFETHVAEAEARQQAQTQQAQAK